jgi:HK97 family phage major capsid protein
MNQNIETIRNSIQTLADKLETITASAAKANRSLTDSEQIAAESIQAAIESQQAIVRESKAIDVVRSQEEREARAQGRSSVSAIPRVTSKTNYDSIQDAFDCGQWFRASFLGHEGARQHCRDRGLIKGALSTGIDTAGGILTPLPLQNAVVTLREKFGVARQNALVIGMGAGDLVIPKLATEISAFFVGEGTTIPTSDISLNSVKLSAKKMATLQVFSNEISDDSVVSIAEMIAESVAQSFAILEDQCVFLGDGTSTYGGVNGLQNALLAGSLYTATSRQTFSALTLADFESMIGQAKVYNGSSPKWYMSRAGFAASAMRLVDAVGGNTNATLATGPSMTTFLGYPVEFTEVLEKRLTGTTGLTFGYFGDLRKGVVMGSRKEITLALDSSRFFDSDSIALRAVARWDAVVHDVGTSTASGGIVRGIFG